MTQPPWEEVEVPRGSFIGWGTYQGQYVMGKVISYDMTGGTDFNGNVCPRLDIELREAAASFDKDMNRTDHQAGEFVVINCGLANLKRAVQAANLNMGDLVKITLEGFEKVDKGTVKIFGIKVARGAGGPVGQTQQPAPSSPPTDQQFGQPAAQQAPPAAPPQQFGAGQPAQQPGGGQSFGQPPAGPPPSAPPADPWGAAPTAPAGAEPPF